MELNPNSYKRFKSERERRYKRRNAMKSIINNANFIENYKDIAYLYAFENEKIIREYSALSIGDMQKIWNKLTINDSEADNTIIINWLIASRFHEQGYSHAINEDKLRIVSKKSITQLNKTIFSLEKKSLEARITMAQQRLEILSRDNTINHLLAELDEMTDRFTAVLQRLEELQAEPEEDQWFVVHEPA
jgi:hypothetical protein